MEEQLFEQFKLLVKTTDKISFANSQPANLRPLFSAIAKIPNNELNLTIQAGEKLANSINNGNTNDAKMLEDTFSQLHKTYKALPIEATRVIMSQAPAQARPILAVAKEMDEKTVKNIAKDIPDIVEAGKKLQDSNTKNADSLSHIDPDAVGRIHSHYKALNNKAKRALIKEIPEQARPMAKAMAHMETKILCSIVKQLPELTKAMEIVMKKNDNGNNNGTNDAKIAGLKRLEAAKKLHRVFKQIPSKARQEMAEVLPKEARGVVEMADGIAEDDIGIILNTIDEKSNNSNNNNMHDDDGGEDEDINNIEKGRKKKTKEQIQKEKMMQGAKLVARAEARRLWKWVLAGPTSLRVLTFLCGTSLIISGAIGFWIEIFNKFRFFAIGSNVYILLAGILISSLEIKSVLCTTYVRSQVYNFFHFLSLMRGRGGFLLFFALFNFAIIDTTTGGWTEILNIISGILCFLVGVYTIIAGILAERKLKSAKIHLGNIEDVRLAFDAADEFGEGKLGPDGIIELLHRLDPPTILTKAELMAAINLMDSDHNGFIETAEFLQWYTGEGNITGRNITKYGTGDTQNTKMEDIQKSCMQNFTHGIVSFVTTIALIVVCVGAFIGIFNELGLESTSADFIIRIFVDAACVLISLFGILVELHVRVKQLPIATIVQKEAKFLSRMWGRGVFLMLFSTFVLSNLDVEFGKETLSSIGGLLLLGAGIFNVVTGICTEKALRSRSHLSYEEALSAFEMADADHNGILDSSEFPTVIAKLNIGNLSRYQLEAAFMSMDLDGDGTISKAEFLEWSQGKDNFFAPPASNATEKQDTSEGMDAGLLANAS